MLEQQVESLGHRDTPRVDKIDVATQVADGHSRHAHSRQEDQSAHRGGVEASMTGTAARDRDQADSLVVAQGVGADAEVCRGGGDVPIRLVVASGELPQRGGADAPGGSTASRSASFSRSSLSTPRP